jgi:peptidoglycan/LPS O-acetylase OafA/YrhL
MLLVFYRSRVGLLIASIATGPPLRVLFWLLWGARGLEHSFPVVMDALATGCLLAALQPQIRNHTIFFRNRWILLVAAGTLLLPILELHHNRLYQVFGLTALHIGIAVSIQHAVLRQYRVLNSRAVVWLGVLSYSLYLWQQPFLNRNADAGWNAFPMNLLAAFLMACVCHYGVEKPFLALRERRSRRNQPAAMRECGQSTPLRAAG